MMLCDLGNLKKEEERKVLLKEEFCFLSISQCIRISQFDGCILTTHRFDIKKFLPLIHNSPPKLANSTFKPPATTFQPQPGGEEWTVREHQPTSAVRLSHCSATVHAGQPLTMCPKKQETTTMKHKFYSLSAKMEVIWKCEVGRAHTTVGQVCEFCCQLWRRSGRSGRSTAWLQQSLHAWTICLFDIQGM